MGTSRSSIFRSKMKNQAQTQTNNNEYHNKNAQMLKEAAKAIENSDVDLSNTQESWIDTLYATITAKRIKPIKQTDIEK